MKSRQLGQSELMVMPLAFGGNVLGWTIDEKQSFRVLDHFTELGFNFIDTADVYSRWASGIGGESETILGKWMKSKKNRNQVIIASKVGMDMGDGKKGLSKTYILNAVEDSLRRLQTEYIDLYQSHKDDPSLSTEPTLEAYAQLIKEGKIRVAGASNFSSARLKEAIALSSQKGLPRYQSLQPHYNLCERQNYESDLREYCLQEKIGVIPYYSLAAGFLTGKYRQTSDSSKSIRGAGAMKYLNAKGIQILEALDAISVNHHCRPAAIALAWLLAKPEITAPIVSATSVKQLDEIAVAPAINLSAEEVALLDTASAY